MRLKRYKSAQEKRNEKALKRIKEHHTCSFCGHCRSKHSEGNCSGHPIVSELDAGGDCPCNGFLERDKN